MKPEPSRAGEPRRLTLEQWSALEEDVEGELVDGTLVEEEVPTYVHETVVAWLMLVLGLWVKARGHKVFGSEAKLAVGPRQGRKPDVMVFARGALPRGRDSVARVAPMIAVEVITSTPRDERRDRVEKLRDYARCGVRYYWLLDPAFRTLEILQRDRRGRFVVVLSSERRTRIRRVPGCPGLTLDLEELWREVEEAEAR